MDDLPLAERVFPFRLAGWLPLAYASHLRRLRHLLERLGREAALAAWQEACRAPDDGLLAHILQAGWQPPVPGEAVDVEAAIAPLAPAIFPVAVEGVSAEEAGQLVEALLPLAGIRRAIPSLNACKDLTAHQALHLRFRGLALLTEALIHRHGKQGELIAYDLQRDERIRAANGETGSVAEFLSGFASPPEGPSLFSAGLDSEVVGASAHEVVVHVKQCAWARYFRERHPQVGYLLACSTDEADYRAFNGQLRLQRTSTLMEGGAVCDFRVYVAAEPPGPEPG